MGRAVRLDDRLSGVEPPAGAPHHLRDERKRALARAVILRIQALVRVQHAHERDVFKIQPLGHHLGAEQDVRLALCKPREQLFVRALGGHGVRVHAQHARGREALAQLLLHLLRARRFGKQALAAAHRAFARDLDRRAAVVAHRAAGHRVVGHIRRAGGALGHPAAQRAADHAAVAAPVEEQDRLLALFQRVQQRAFQLRADHARAPLARKAAHIRDQHVRQPRAEKALGQPEHGVFALLRAVIGLDRGGRGAEHEQRVFLRGAVLGHVARMVARRLLGAVRAVLLLVDDEHAEVLHRREYSRPRADHDARPAGSDLFEAVVPLAHGQRRVHDRDLVPEQGGELPQHLRRQPDLGHEHDRAFALGQRLFDQL